MATFHTSVLLLGSTIHARNRLRVLLSLYARLRVMAEASTAAQAFEYVRRLSPDAVVAEAELPGLEGVLRSIARMQHPRSANLVAVSLGAAPGGFGSRAALVAAGASKVVAAPDPSASPESDAAFARTLFLALSPAGKAERRKLPEALGLHVASPADLLSTAASLGATLPPRSVPDVAGDGADGSRVVIIGASTGGPQALEKILSAAHPSWPLCYLIVQHMSADVTSSLGRHLALRTGLAVAKARQGDTLAPGKVLIAPGGHHLTFGRDGRIRLGGGPEVNHAKPSIDVTMAAASQVFGSRTIGLVLTGMGTDGARGIELIKEAGGATIAQDSASSTVYGMPKAAFETGKIDHVVGLSRMATTLERLSSSSLKV